MDLSSLASLPDDQLSSMQSQGWLTPEQAQAAQAARVTAAGGGPTLAEAPPPMSSAAGGPPPALAQAPPPMSPAAGGPADDPGLGMWSDSSPIAARADAENQARAGALVRAGLNGDERAALEASERKIPDAVAQPQAAPPQAAPFMPVPRAGAPSAAMRALQAQSAASSQTVLDSLDSDRGGIGAARDTSQAQAWGTQGALANLNDTTDLIQEQKAAAWQHASSSMQSQEDDLRRQADAIKDVDPDHYWDSKSTGSKILAGIGVALGAFGAGMPHSGLGGRNYALETINNGISADIDAQKSNIKKAWDKIATGKELAKDTYAQSLYEQDQYDKLGLHAIDKVRNQVAGYAAQSADSEQQQKLSALDAQLAQQRDGIVQQQLQRRMAYLQQGQGSALIKAGQEYQKYFATQAGKGEAAMPFSDFARGYMGGGSTPGGVAGAATDPLAGVPERNRAAATAELPKYVESAQRMQQIAAARATALGTLPDGTPDPNSSVIQRYEARELHNALVVEEAKSRGTGRSEEDVAKFVAPGLLSSNPFVDNNVRAKNVAKLLPPPPTPFLGARTPQLPPSPQLPPGARQVVR